MASDSARLSAAARALARSRNRSCSWQRPGAGSLISRWSCSSSSSRRARESAVLRLLPSAAGLHRAQTRRRSRPVTNTTPPRPEARRHDRYPAHHPRRPSAGQAHHAGPPIWTAVHSSFDRSSDRADVDDLCGERHRCGHPSSASGAGTGESLPATGEDHGGAEASAGTHLRDGPAASMRLNARRGRPQPAHRRAPRCRCRRCSRGERSGFRHRGS